MDMTYSHKINEIKAQLVEYIGGKEESIELALIAIFSNGHLLIEDLPGLGKTTLALGLAKSLGLGFGRVQATNDLLPSDIVGVSIFDKNTNQFNFHKGPVFNDILLLDEINRATPRTQSALLEAMAERQVTADGKTYDLSNPFFVIATQNPVEHNSTFDLPEAQLDRFLIKMSIGYPTEEAEIEILGSSQAIEKRYEDLKSVLSRLDVINIQNDISSNVEVSREILSYVVRLARTLREDKRLVLGVSLRANVFLIDAVKTYSYFDGRDYVKPEDIKKLFHSVISHRIVVKDEYSDISKDEIINELLNSIAI